MLRAWRFSRSIVLTASLAIAGGACVIEEDDGDGDGDRDDDNDGDGGGGGGGGGGGDQSEPCLIDGVDQCTGEDICIDQECVAAFGRTYRFWLTAAVATHTPTGDDWDFGAGAPDPLGYLAINGDLVLETEEQSDTFEAAFTTSASAVMPAGATLTFGAIDVDVSEHDYILECEGVCDAQWLRNGWVSCEADGTVIDVVIEAQ
jgi:hypothetical protein